MPTLYRKQIFKVFEIFGIKFYREVETDELYMKVGKGRTKKVFKNKDNKNKKA
ncbi:hypothetical protein [Bacillus thuringiensis]|uniref:hypothetical protein n=1 Tax=Bacillus thuringiensis TaxID=1428 RepID=UPI0021D6923E|nr:hypothetical protein [Bacillus thuringiensis]MCU7667712.1 hypothetical protein [Bacillus thuringiensis]